MNDLGNVVDSTPLKKALSENREALIQKIRFILGWFEGTQAEYQLRRFLEDNYVVADKNECMVVSRKWLEEQFLEFPPMILGEPAIFGRIISEHEKGYDEGYLSARKEVYDWLEKFKKELSARIEGKTEN
jgi:hypothetical protein